MDDLVGQPTRRRIVADVAGHPGTSAREIQHRLGLGWGETAYHLDLLIKGEAIRRERGGRRDYYFPPEFTWEDRKLLLTLQSPTERAMLVVLAQSGGLTFVELQERVGIGKSTASFHLHQLVDRGAVESFWETDARKYRLTRPDRVKELVATYRETFGDRLVDRFVESFSVLLRD